MSEMILAEVGKLPATSDPAQWNDRERALAMTLGLASQKKSGEVEVADRGTIEVFLSQCQRTQLDPIARQIYCIKRGNKWGVQISIDGARLIAERSGEYEGQTPAEWTADGVTWVQVWLSDVPPAAARVGVHRRGFRAALYAVARWDSYAVYNDEWVNRQKTGNRVLSPMWAKMPDLMLGKVAEMLALRKAFPQDLSGLYSTEEMDQAGGSVATSPRSPQPSRGPVDVDPNHGGPSAAELAEVIVGEVVEPEKPVEPEFDQDHWALRIQQCTTVESLRALWEEAQSAGVLGAPFGDMRLGDALRGFKTKLEAGR